jgi:hypothetical protein
VPVPAKVAAVAANAAAAPVIARMHV